MMKKKFTYGQRRRRFNGLWIFGITERVASNQPLLTHLVRVRNRKEATLLPMIRRHVEPRSRIMSDMWASYTNLAAYGYNHGTVNHTLRFVDVFDRTVHINTIEGIWGDFKEFIRHKRGIRKTYINDYLKEYSFRKYFRRENLMASLLPWIAVEFQLGILIYFFFL